MITLPEELHTFWVDMGDGDMGFCGHSAMGHGSHRLPTQRSSMRWDGFSRGDGDMRT